MKYPPREGDLPRDKLVEQANRDVDSYECAVDCYFKYTCEHCGNRCMLQEPNKLYEKGECCQCGLETEIKFGGYALHIRINEPKRDPGYDKAN